MSGEEWESSVLEELNADEIRQRKAAKHWCNVCDCTAFHAQFCPERDDDE